VKKLAVVLVLATALSGCGIPGRVASVGKPPKLSAPEQMEVAEVEPSLSVPADRVARSATTQPAAAPSASLFRTGAGAFFRDQRATTTGDILTIRIDESLTYLNARWLEEFVLESVADHPQAKHLVLMCSAVNAIDGSALESVEAINHRLADGGVALHLSEVKGPVMDALERSSFLGELTGRVFLSQDSAFASLLDAEEAVPPPREDLSLARGLI